jgi:hypothetical protein
MGLAADDAVDRGPDPRRRLVRVGLTASSQAMTASEGGISAGWLIDFSRLPGWTKRRH